MIVAAIRFVDDFQVILASRFERNRSHFLERWADSILGAEGDLHYILRPVRPAK
jgi:hypothetical protein